MRYTVTVMEHVGTDIDHSRQTYHYYSGRSLKEAWRICERHARRGLNRFGGRITRGNWGMRAGAFPDAYRGATIRVECSAAPAHTGADDCPCACCAISARWRRRP